VFIGKVWHSFVGTEWCKIMADGAEKRLLTYLRFEPKGWLN